MAKGADAYLPALERVHAFVLLTGVENEHERGVEALHDDITGTTPGHAGTGVSNVVAEHVLVVRAPGFATRPHLHDGSDARGTRPEACARSAGEEQADGGGAEKEREHGDDTNPCNQAVEEREGWLMARPPFPIL